VWICDGMHATYSSMALKGLPANSPMASVSATVLKDRSPPAAIDITARSEQRRVFWLCGLFNAIAAAVRHGRELKP
jgi:hypothetical protein